MLDWNDDMPEAKSCCASARDFEAARQSAATDPMREPSAKTYAFLRRLSKKPSPRVFIVCFQQNVDLGGRRANIKQVRQQ